jgi:hypothetical protein
VARLLKVLFLVVTKMMVLVLSGLRWHIVAMAIFQAKPKTVLVGTLTADKNTRLVIFLGSLLALGGPVETVVLLRGLWELDTKMTELEIFGPRWLILAMAIFLAKPETVPVGTPMEEKNTRPMTSLGFVLLSNLFATREGLLTVLLTVVIKTTVLVLSGLQWLIPIMAIFLARLKTIPVGTPMEEKNTRPMTSLGSLLRVGG